MDKYIKNWHNCYDDGWKGIIVPEAFAHPAKMAYGLTQKIFKHALSEGWLAKGDIVVDPFGGIGSTGIIGAYMGIEVVCVELEQKFVSLARNNYGLHMSKLAKLGCPLPRMLLGDSRNLSDVIDFTGNADIVISSPPYASALGNRSHEGDQEKYIARQQKYNDAHPEYKRPSAESMAYPNSPGQLGAMKPGSVDAVVSSPPYAGGAMDQSGGNTTMAQGKAIDGSQRGGKSIVTGYGTTPGNLGNLKPGEVDAVVSSPPYEGSFNHSKNAGREENFKRRASKMKYGGLASYSDNDKQIGNYVGETFWQAARQIVAECHKILKPGGHAIWVVKAFVRKGAIVDFPGDWRRLCEAQGFKTIHEHHAMLVKETKHNGLFEEIATKKERKSFFRRLAEKKGSPAIDYEVVLCMIKG